MEVSSLYRLKNISIWVMTLTIAFTLSFATSASTVKAEEEDPLGINAEAAILLDAETGKILYAKNPDVVLGVASMSKMMTEYLLLEAIDEGKITWDQKVKINSYVHELSAAPELSNVGLTEGEEYTVEELYQAMAIHSGNAATVALAELMAGTETNFITLMNKKAEELQLGDYKFVNSSGLNNSSLLGNHPAGGADEENVMSARATAKLAYYLINDYPEVIETAKMPELQFRDGRTYKNFNWMLPGLIFEYEGVDGLKTGSTDFAGAGFTATAEKNGQRYIAVIMKAATKDERFTEMRKVLDYAFGNFTEEEIVEKGYQVKNQTSLPVTKGKADEVSIESKESISMVVKNGEKDQYKTVLTLDKDKLNEDGELTAPVKKGDKVGTLTIEPTEGEGLGFLTEDGQKQITVDVIATEDVEKANWFVLMMRGIGGFFGRLWDSASSAVKGIF